MGNMMQIVLENISTFTNGCQKNTGLLKAHKAIRNGPLVQWSGFQPHPTVKLVPTGVLED